MKTALVFLSVIGIAWLMIFEFVAGSHWCFVTSKEIVLYKYVGAPIAALPVVANIEAGQRLSVVGCFFDKNDAYLLVSNDGKILGYTFDNKHKFHHSWRAIMPSDSSADFWKSLTCFQFVGQFNES